MIECGTFGRLRPGVVSRQLVGFYRPLLPNVWEAPQETVCSRRRLSNSTGVEPQSHLACTSDDESKLQNQKIHLQGLGHRLGPCGSASPNGGRPGNAACLTHSWREGWEERLLASCGSVTDALKDPVTPSPPSEVFPSYSFCHLSGE